MAVRYFWQPDLQCSGSGCVVEVDKDGNVIEFVKKCPIHAVMIGNDKQIVDSILTAMRDKAALHVVIDA